MEEGKGRWIKIGGMRWISTYLGDASDEFSWHNTRQEERAKRMEHLKSELSTALPEEEEEKENFDIPPPHPGDPDYADVAHTPPHRAPPKLEQRRPQVARRPPQGSVAPTVPARKARMFTPPDRSTAPVSRRTMISPSTSGLRRTRAHSKYLEMCAPPPPSHRPSPLLQVAAVHRPSPLLVRERLTRGSDPEGVTAFELRLLEDTSRDRPTPGSPGAPLVVGGPPLMPSRSRRCSFNEP